MLTEQEFVGELADYVQRCLNQRTAAKELGVSPQYLNDVLNGRRAPGEKLTRAMGYSRLTYYQQAAPAARR
jgi:phage portal protein BeeE